MEDESTRIKQQLLELARETHNAQCADCGESDPQWASANLGIFICIMCAGIHRNLGVHISRVRSVMLDIWRLEELEVMINTGNKISNEKWEAGLGEVSPIRTTDSGLLREQWIRAKYVRKLYLSSGDSPRPPGFPTMEGYMTKMGDLVRNWRRRYFKLSGSTLFYYAKPSDAVAKGSLSLLEVTRPPDCLLDSPHNFCFVINTPSRDYMLYADTGENMYDWIQKLRTARRYLSIPGTFGHNKKASDIGDIEVVVKDLANLPSYKKKNAHKAVVSGISGTQVIDMFIHKFQLQNRQEGVLLGQTLLDKGLLHSLHSESFADSVDRYYHL